MMPVSRRHHPPAWTRHSPEGYFKAAFDYYFKGANPRQAIDPARADGSRRLIANAAATVGGAWLISGKGEQRARTEMPTAPQFRVQRVFQHDLVSLYHVAPVVTVGQ